jgi:hypothetical protein
VGGNLQTDAPKLFLFGPIPGKAKKLGLLSIYKFSLVYSTPVLTTLTEQKLKQEWQNSPAGTRQTDSKHLVWFGEIRKKISQIIKDYFCLPFFLLIILWLKVISWC